jgi:transposase
LSEENKQQVIALGRLGWSLRRIQRATGVRRETAATYLKAAGIAFRPPGKWGRAPAKPANGAITDSDAAKAADPVNLEPPTAKPANEVITDFGAELATAPPGRSPTSSACESYRETIELGIARGRNAMAIWQDLVDTCGFTASYQSVQRFVHKLHPSPSPEARVVIETAVGEECQVDYGDGPMVRNPATGKYRRTRLFVMTLGYSRKSVRLLVFHSSSRIWAELHEKAFRRLTGVTRVVVLDFVAGHKIEHDDARRTTQPAEGLLVQLRPSLRTGARHQQADRFTAVAQSQYEQARAAVLTAVRVAHHGARAVIDLRLFTGRGLDHHARFRRGWAAQLAHESLDALVAAGEAVDIDQVLEDGRSVAPTGEP